MAESYEINLYHREKNADGSNNSVVGITSEEYFELEAHREFRNFIGGVVEAYEHIVLNYRDFELSNFSAILNDVLLDKDPESVFAARSAINRHLVNMLGSTYLYVCLLRINKKDTKDPDTSIENSTDTQIVHSLKESFQAVTNGYHLEYYQYTFMSALRNRLNHGGSLEKVTELGTEWSIRRVPEGEENDGSLKKDHRYSILDQRVPKDQARKIISPKHYRNVEHLIPNSFYIREAIRKYIGLISAAHSEVKNEARGTFDLGEERIRSYLPVDGSYEATLVRRAENGKEKSASLGSSRSLEVAYSGSAKSPLGLEYHLMPGEPSSVPK